MNSEKHLPNPEIPEHEWETIKELNLTNAEWMRYRLNHELPERAEILIRQRFKDQTTPRSKPAKSVEVQRQTEDAFEEQKPRFLEKLDSLVELSHGSVDWEKLVQKVLDFQESVRPFFIEGMEDKKYVSAMNEKTVMIFDNIIKKTDKPQISTEDRAKGFVALSHLLDQAFNSYELYPVMAEKIRQYIDKGNFDLLTILLTEESFVRNMSFYELSAAHKDQVAAHGYSQVAEAGADIQLEKSLLASIAVPLTIHIQKTVARQGLETVDIETRYLDWLVEKLQIPGVLQELAGKGFDLKRVADNYINALLQDYDRIGGGYPSHYQTGNIITLIENLYAPINGKRLPVTDGAIKLVKKLYDEKIAPYKPKEEQQSWIYYVSKKLGLTPDVIDPAYKAA